MKAHWISTLAGAMALCMDGSASAAVEHYSCKRLAGGPISPFALTIDYNNKTVDLPQSSGLITEDGLATITDSTVKWIVARGGVEFDRRTLVLAWDMTDDHDYLEATGQFVDPVENYRGTMQCVVDRGHKGP